MEFELYDDINTFYLHTYNILLQNEVQNIVLLGNLIRGMSGVLDSAQWLMATVSDNGGVKLIALMTPPHKITLYATNNVVEDNAIDCLISGILKTDFFVPGVLSKNDLAERFAQIFTQKTGKKAAVEMRQMVHSLTSVNDVPIVGVLRAARDSDISFLPYWLEHFYSSCLNTGFEVGDNKESYHKLINAKMYVLEVESQPVSIARINREVNTTAHVTYVYTPPYFRGKGYATSCVALLSRLILNNGFKNCSLYTDLANPISNSIYKKIGYLPVCNSLEIKFE